MPPQISFIIPALNEGQLLRSTLGSISKALRDAVPYEVIVVDHDSTDDTVQVAKESGARVLSVSGGTIASVRNEGARSANGSVLVFLDADVLLSETWARDIRRVVNELAANPRLVTGSWVGVPDDGGLLSRFWYEPLTKRANTHINSGHMIVTASFFDELGGFDRSLETGEDYDFSMRALRAGGRVKDDQNLPVVHLGYPTGWRAFFRRELWHGLGDYASVGAFLSSKVAILATVFLLAHLCAVAAVIWLSPRYTAMCLSAIVAICLVSSIVKYRSNGISVIAVNAVVYYLYFWARAAALGAVAFGIDAGRVRPRSGSSDG